MPSKGVVVTGHSLAIRGVTRNQAGRYVCAASNVEGDSYSVPITLEVNCKRTILCAPCNIKILNKFLRSIYCVYRLKVCV